MVNSTGNLHIWTARIESLVNSQGGGGYGFENPNAYKGVSRFSFSQNYKLIQKAFSEMWKLSLEMMAKDGETEKLTTKIMKTGWYSQIDAILQSAHQIAKTISKEKANVLIYCPLGNSSTPLLTSLAQLFCDPFFRSINGFMTLVHKEWIYYRHNFQKKSIIYSSKQ